MNDNINNNENENDEINDNNDIDDNQRNWIFEHVLETNEEKNEYFKINSFWKIKRKNNLKSGIKTYYYCNVLKDKCPAELSLFAKSDVNSFILMRRLEHTHANDKKSCRMDENVFKKIEEMYALGMKKRSISHSLRNNEEVHSVPSENQVFS